MNWAMSQLLGPWWPTRWNWGRWVLRCLWLRGNMGWRSCGRWWRSAGINKMAFHHSSVDWGVIGKDNVQESCKGSWKALVRKEAIPSPYEVDEGWWPPNYEVLTAKLSFWKNRKKSAMLHSIQSRSSLPCAVTNQYLGHHYGIVANNSRQ